VYEGGVVGGFTIQADNSLLLFMEGGRIAQLKHGKIHTVVEEIPDERTTRFNDVIADPRGRVFCGTMPTEERLGRLYRLDPDGKLSKLVEGIGCSNGLAFSPDCTHLYYTDSQAYAIYRFEYSGQSGDITNQEVFIRCLEADGEPDGLTCDSEGYLWSARWGGGCVIRYSPEGIEERRIALPAKLVTSLAFGGPSLSEIYVTTAKDTGVSDPEPDSGAVFRLSTGIRGVAEFLSRIQV
jgi:D-xylonolactonase